MQPPQPVVVRRESEVSKLEQQLLSRRSGVTGPANDVRPLVRVDNAPWRSAGTGHRLS